MSTAIAGSASGRRIPGFASGGSRPANSPFWVGENGPELMQLGSKGHVWDHHSSLRMAGGGPAFSTTLTVNVAAPGSDPKQVAAAVRSELVAHERRTVAEFRQLVGS